MRKDEQRQMAEPVPLIQVLFDDMFLLLLVGVAVPFLIYIVWGLMDIGSLPPLPAAESATMPQASQRSAEELVRNLGCLGCHSTDGSERFGPTWKGLFGASITLADGSTITADEAYLRESILNPNAKVARGYPVGAMPNYQGRISSVELETLIEYMKGLK